MVLLLILVALLTIVGTVFSLIAIGQMLMNRDYLWALGQTMFFLLFLISCLGICGGLMEGIR